MRYIAGELGLETVDEVVTDLRALHHIALSPVSVKDLLNLLQELQRAEVRSEVEHSE